MGDSAGELADRICFLHRLNLSFKRLLFFLELGTARHVPDNVNSVARFIQKFRRSNNL